MLLKTLSMCGMLTLPSLLQGWWKTVNRHRVTPAACVSGQNEAWEKPLASSVSLLQFPNSTFRGVFTFALVLLWSLCWRLSPLLSSGLCACGPTCANTRVCAPPLTSPAAVWCTGKSAHCTGRPGVACAGGFFPCAGQVHNSRRSLWVPADLRKA